MDTVKNAQDLAREDFEWIFAPDNEPQIVFPNPHKDAQWYPDAKLGLMMHFGIHSVEGIQPSWAMIKGFPYTRDDEYTPPEEYFKLAKRFNPLSYDMDKIISAAADGGFKYAVLTAKHHEGYALWPSKFGTFNTGIYMGGRDLLLPYVEACRKHNVKVGLYFSQRDWHYPNYPVSDVEFDYSKRQVNMKMYYEKRNQEEFKQFMIYTLGQLREILTRYGKIDVLWFDGLGWPGIMDYKLPQVYAWIRSLQPGIVINDRWQGTVDPNTAEKYHINPHVLGDFGTLECVEPEDAKGNWWELCNCGGTENWGCGKNPDLKDFKWIIEYYEKCKKLGCNYLCNISPLGDGSMLPKYYQYCEKMKAYHAKK